MDMKKKMDKKVALSSFITISLMIQSNFDLKTKI